MRENIRRSEDTTKPAYNLQQLIEQHGASGWFNELAKEIGPMALLQLQDMANFLEILRKYVHFRDSWRTKTTRIKLNPVDAEDYCI